MRAVGRWLVYLAALTASLLFFTFYQEWVSFLIVVVVFGLPWFSLLVSLRAMRRFYAQITGADTVTVGTKATVQLEGRCDLPMPPFHGRLCLRYCMTGVKRHCRKTAAISTRHSGAVEVMAKRVWVFDYLGLIGIPARRVEPRRVTVRPQAVPMKSPAGIEYLLARAWRPRYGGGYSEYHEMRPYRPGDNLNQIHWKLTAKTGDLIVREPMQPDQGAVLLTVELVGTPDELDRKLGRLLFFGSYLLERGISFEVCALTATAQLQRAVATQADLLRVLDQLLCCEVAENAVAVTMPASRQICIGGEPE